MKPIKSKTILILLVFCLFFNVFPVFAVEKNDNRAFQRVNRPQIRNIIFFVGDGMGLQNRRAAALTQSKGNPEFRLAMENLTTSGVAYNHCLDQLVTDSAASGTALATGEKTNYHMISTSPDGKKIKTILEVCKDLGMSTGLITTVQIAHATPAVFGAHVKDRNMMNEIAAQYLDNKIDVLLGGGRNDFLPILTVAVGEKQGINSTDKYQYGNRRDGKNLLKEFDKSGYTMVFNRSELLKIDPHQTRRLIGLFNKEAMAFEVDRAITKEPHIAEMTSAALKILSRNPRGFFLMVEGGKIDWANHNHDVSGSVYDTIALDQAVKVAINFAKHHPQTLIIIVNDHETGGLSITANVNIKAIRNMQASSDRIAGMMKDNPEKLNFILKEYAGIDNLTNIERKILFSEACGKKDSEWNYGNSNCPISDIIAKRTGIGFCTNGHTGGPVVVGAYGPGCSIFDGFYDQTQIPVKILKLMGIRVFKPSVK